MELTEIAPSDHDATHLDGIMPAHMVALPGATNIPILDKKIWERRAHHPLHAPSPPIFNYLPPAIPSSIFLNTFKSAAIVARMTNKAPLNNPGFLKRLRYLQSTESKITLASCKKRIMYSAWRRHKKEIPVGSCLLEFEISPRDLQPTKFGKNTANQFDSLIQNLPVVRRVPYPKLTAALTCCSENFNFPINITPAY